jgi:hypothetical protein
MRQIGKVLSIALLGSLVFIACRKGEITGQNAPETQLSFEVINLSGQNRLNSSVKLSWFGTDLDGYIEAYEFSLDEINWVHTLLQDSTFVFDIPPGQDSVDIDFYVRAIDNDGLTDPSPAYLRVPLINTPPSAAFLDDRGPGDTAFIAATFFWNASDPDGNESLKEVQIKVNNNAWQTIDRKQNLITLLPDTSTITGEAISKIYYGTSTAAATNNISGLRANDNNRLYIRAIDIADAISPVDTSEVFYFRAKTPGVNTLWLSGHGESTTAEYKGYLNAKSIPYDLLNIGAQQGANMPKYFDPTVQLIFLQYKNAFLNLSATNFRNTVTGDELPLIDYLAPVIQRFADAGGNYFLTTVFTKTQDISNIRSVYPIDAIVTSTVPSSQARIVSDSALVPMVDPSLPSLNPSNVEFGVVPMIASADAQKFYRAQITRFRGWDGNSDVVAAVRRRNSKISQVFFCLELHRFDKNVGDVEALIGDIFNNEFK